MPTELPILLSSAGRRVELLRLLRQEAVELGLAPRLIAVDARPELSAACHEADVSFSVPPVRSAEFVPSLLEICRREGIRLLVPTIDPELAHLAEARGRFEALGVFVAVSAPEVVAATADKLVTSRLLEGSGLAAPRTMAAREVIDAPDACRWPMVVKPIEGSASLGVAVVHDVQELEGALSRRADLIVQERVEGPEYTVNFFVDQSGACRAAVPHLRREQRAGEVSKGITVRDESLSSIAHRLAESLKGALGPLCFQAIRSIEGPKVIDINARFGGGYPLAHRAGAPFTRWLIEMCLGADSTANDRWRPGTWMLRYDEGVFGTVDSDAEQSRWLE